MPNDSSPDDADDGGDDPSGVAVDGVTDGDADVQGTIQIDGQEAPLELSDEIVEAVQDADDVSLDDVAAAAAPTGDVDFKLGGQNDAGETVTVPVKDIRDYDLTSARFSSANRFQFIGDDRIQKLEKNSVTYTEQVGDWILSKDDLVPAIKERLKALILGEGGMTVDPADPSNDDDVRLAELHREQFKKDVQPTKVIDTILEQNMKNARAVLRSTDLDPLDLDHLAYFRDGVTGEEIYWQSDVRVHTFDVDDAGDDVGSITDIGLEEVDIDGQPLVIGEHVFDISLYDKPPLEAVADTVVNKKQMQRLKARKAEITSFGGIYVKVNPPEYLPEDEYFDRVETSDGDTVTKLERALEQNLDSAFDWAKGYQSGTTGSVPMHWDVEQVEIPEGDEPLDAQIRGYNKDISRRLLVPIDLIELREGSELSRETLMQTLLTTIQGWRQEIIRVFEQFSEVQADIHDLDGDVEFGFPPLNDANVEAITNLLNFAGVLGATSDELRQMANQIQGVDLEVDQNDSMDDLDTDQTAPGGPQNPADRTEQMRNFLDDQNRTGADDDQDDQADADPPTSRREAMKRQWSPTATVDTDAAQAADAFEATVFRVVAPEEDADRFEDDVLGIGIEFPNHDVYVDWRNSVFPDELENPHVSIYGSIEDLEQATGNIVEPMDTVGIDAAKTFVDTYAIDADVDDVVDAAGGDVSRRDVLDVAGDKFTPPDGLDIHELDGWDQTSVWRAFLSLGGQHSTCSKKMTGDVRNPDAWCAALKDSALGTDLWRQGSGAEADLEAADFQIDYEGSLGDLADIFADVLDENGADVTRLQEEDDYVAFNLGDADPTDDDPDGDFEPVVIVGGGGSFQVTGLQKSSDLLDGLDDQIEAHRIPVTAAHGFTGPTSLREAGQQVRRQVEDQLPQGHTVEMVRRDQDTMSVIVYDGNGDIAGSMTVTESSVHDDEFIVTGTDDFFRHLPQFQDTDKRQTRQEASLSARFRSWLSDL